MWTPITRRQHNREHLRYGSDRSVQLTLTSRIGGWNLDAESIAGLCCFGNCASGVTITGGEPGRRRRR
jgi:hypothetical protein